MTAWPDARRAAYAAAEQLAPAVVPLGEAHGCVLAGALWSLVPVPAFDTAAMDGWAVRGPGPWRVIGRVLAGHPSGMELHDGDAMEVATGAQVPPGTDGVLPYEQGVAVGAELTGLSPEGRHVRRTGEECPERTTILGAGTVLTAAALGLAASVGHDELTVHPLPRVAALVTGDELLASGLPGDGRIRDAVGPLLSAAVGGCGGRLVGPDHLGDDASLLRKAIEASDADVVVTTGASSVGRADFLPLVLQQLGATLVVNGVDVRPGHPQVLAQLPDGRFVVGLPGNPLAALAGMVTTLVPLLARLGGRPFPELTTARVTEPLTAAGSTRLVPVAVRDGLARPTGHGGAAMLRGAATADAFAVVPAGTDLPAASDVELVELPR